MGFKKPKLSKPIANYKKYIINNGIIYISGQLPIYEGKLEYKGKIIEDISLESTKKAIQLATANLLWVLNESLIDHNLSEDKIKTLNIKGYLNCKSNFVDHSNLFNESSDLLINILGKEKGIHSRSVIGVTSLPMNSPVEIDGIFSIL